MTDGGYAWASEPEKELYKNTVLVCLDEPRLGELLEQRPSVTDEAVVEAMCSSPYVERVLGDGEPRLRHSLYRRTRRSRDWFRRAMPARPSLRRITENATFLPERLGPPLCFLVFIALGVFGLTPVISMAAAVLMFVVPVLAFAQRDTTSPGAPGTPAAWLRVVRLVCLGPVASLLWTLEWWDGHFWVRELRDNGLQEVTEQAVEDLIGEDLGTLLVTSNHEGLRSHHRTAYVVSNRSTGELRQKIEQLADGTIAVSGPRGVGKTTLMKSVVRPEDFSVFAHAPAAYDPRDFLTSLFVSVCREYIVRAGHTAPELVRLSYLHRVRRRVAGPLRALLRPLPYALPAVALLGLGMFAATRKSIETGHRPWGWRYVTDALEEVSRFLGDVLHGRAPGAAAAIAIAGGLVWQLRRFTSFAWLARQLANGVVLVALLALFLGPPVSLFLDADLRHHFGNVDDDPGAGSFLTGLSLLFFAAWGIAAVIYTHPSADGRKLRIGSWSVSWKSSLRPVTILLPFVVLVLIAPGDNSFRPLITDDDTPLRLGAFLLGLLIVALGARSRSFPRTAPTLVADCRDHLYRLQTVQNSTAGLTTGATQFLTLGTSHSSGVTSVPPNYPLLVAEFRRLLGEIARHEHDKGNRVVIAIDEVDRLGTDTKALAFLAEIKGILGVPYVHYLISVAEDVGAAFVRRGLPHRDVTDSSLDDVLHVRPCALDESADILQRRAPHIGAAYIALAHALSGGLPRDLIRYGRRLLDIRTHQYHVELPDVALALITEELSETLAGFRTLLAKQQWEPDTMGVLGSFRSLNAHLRAACPCPEPARRVRLALAHFTAYRATGLPEESRRLIDEAAAYAYFSLTLLDVFGLPDFNQRRATAAQHPDGHLDLLAEARQELGVSPYSARTVIDDIRRAWNLAPVSTQAPPPTVVIPLPRRAECVRHPRP